MKAPPFAYIRPTSLDEIFPLLREYGDDARILAGGQTLLATLNMRLSEPRLLIDIKAIEGLRGITVMEDCISIGAMTRHSEIEDSGLVASHLPLLAMAAPHVAHRAIRNQGTLGGSLAFADPAAEWPACVVALDATVVLVGPNGERRVKAADFFLDLYTTVMEPDELIKACEFALASSSSRFVFLELARRHGDYAIVGLAAAARIDSGRLTALRLVFLGTGNTPIRARAVEEAVVGKVVDAQTLAQAQAALAGELFPFADLYNSAQTKLHLAGVLMGRALRQLAA
ncbi:FAD binding domain-containing protein [Bordetella tumulicola]|uniref:FAD binding domain-containing protein n=1 Tax=Bordetella tumulicola TaxID=1649133 RepID=UPI0039EF2DC2